MSLEKKEHQAVTGGIFYCRASANFSVSASNKLFPTSRYGLCNLTVKCFEIATFAKPETVISFSPTKKRS
jgi:hypothetical protein